MFSSRVSLRWFRSGRHRRAQATVELALSLVILTTLLLGGMVVGSLTNDRMIAANAATSGARLAARLGDGLGLGLTADQLDQQIVDNTVAVARPMTFGRVIGIDIYDPGDQANPGSTFNSDNHVGSAQRADRFICNGAPRDALRCSGPPQPGGGGFFTPDMRQRDGPRVQPIGTQGDGRPIGVQVAWTFNPPNGAYAPPGILFESSVQWTTGEAAEASAPGAVALQPSPLPGQQTISVAAVTGDFYRKHNPNDGTFDADIVKENPVWHQNFHVINFNPDPSLPLYTNSGGSACPHPGVNNFTHPFTNIEEPPGCNGVIAQGNGYQAGGAPPLPPVDQFPVAFEASFQGNLRIGRPGSLVFTIYSDDGWIFALGHDTVTNSPPTPVAPFTLVNPPASPLQNRAGQSYDLIACLNTGSSPAQKTFGVNFPVPGTYPFLLDYTEFAGQSLTLTIGTTLGVPIAPSS